MEQLQPWANHEAVVLPTSCIWPAVVALNATHQATIRGWQFQFWTSIHSSLYKVSRLLKTLSEQELTKQLYRIRD